MILRALIVVLALALALVAVPAIRHAREVHPPPPPVVRAQFAPPPGSVLGAGDAVVDAAISPADRGEIVFVATTDGRVQLWRQAFDTGRAEPLPGTDGASLPAWKCSGRALSFFADGKLKQIALGDSRVIELADAPAPGGAAWRTDGTLLFVPDTGGPVKLMSRGQITDATRLATGDRRHAFPAAAPGGSFVYLATRADGGRAVRWVGPAGERELTAASGSAAIHGDTLLYARDGVLLGSRLDWNEGRLTGRAIPIALEVGVADSGHASFASSARLVVAAGATAGAQIRQVAWHDLHGQRLKALAEPGDYWQVRLSPDDRYAAITILDPLLRTLDILAVPVDSPGSGTRLSLSIGADSDPVWSPDGSLVLFRSVQAGGANLLARALRPAAAPEQTLVRSPLDETASDWSGDTILFHAPGAATRLDLWVATLPAGTTTQITRDAFNERDARWSPDRRWMAFVSDESGHNEVYLAAWPGGDRRLRVSFAGGTRPAWGRSGRDLFFMRGTQILRTEVTTGRDGTLQASTPADVVDAPGLRDFAVAHRSDRLLVVAATRQIDDARATQVVDWSTLVPPPPSPR